MRHRSSKLLLPLSLLLTLCGCQTGRTVYYAATRRLISVPSEGMMPTIKPGDMAAVDKRPYRNSPVRRFDLVTFKLSPEHFSELMTGMDADDQYVQRVVGLGGETLEIRGGIVYIDGRELEEPFATIPSAPREAFGPVKIPAGEFFLLGDNRPNSMDGRHWARPTLRQQNITGKVVEILPR